MSQPTLAFSPAITIVDGKPTILSTDLAHHFGKRHDNVMQTIANLRAQVPKECFLNFQESSVDVEQPNGGKTTYPAYRLTRDGFTLLAMGFTGKKALAFKLAYIDAFNRMEASLHQPADTQRMELAFSLAAEAAAQVHRTVFNAVMQGEADAWQHSRYLLNLNYDSQGRPTQPCAQTIATDQMVVSLNSLPKRIADGDIVSATDAQLATLATACTQRLTERARYREQKDQQQATYTNLPANQQPAQGMLRMTFK